MPRLPFRSVVLCALGVAVLVTLAASCSSPPPPPAPAPAPAPAKKPRATPTPTPLPEPTPTPTPAKRAVAPSDQFKVIAARTPFYLYGPQQPGGPTTSLERGTILTLLKRGFGYSQVKLRNEQTGYVGTEDLAALTAEELLAQEQPEAPAAGDLGPLPRPGGVRRSTLPPATAVDFRRRRRSPCRCRPSPSPRRRPRKRNNHAMSESVTSPVYVVGDNIDTDQIIPAEHLTLVPTIPAEYEQLGSFAMIGLPEDQYPVRFLAPGRPTTPYQPGDRGAELRLRQLARARAHCHGSERRAGGDRGGLRAHLFPQLRGDGGALSRTRPRSG